MYRLLYFSDAGQEEIDKYADGTRQGWCELHQNFIYSLVEQAKSDALAAAARHHIDAAWLVVKMENPGRMVTSFVTKNGGFVDRRKPRTSGRSE